MPYLLLGPEKGKKQAKIKDIIKEIRKVAGSAPEIHRFYPFESDAETILAAAGNGSLFASHSILIINQAETISAKEATLFAAYLKKPNESATLVFLSEESSSSKVSASITKAIGKKNTQVFWELFDSDKKSWLINFFRKENLSITPDGVEYLLEMLENNTSEFRNVCRQLAIFFDPGSELNTEKLEEFLYHSKEESVFTLFAKVAEGDLQGALDILKKISLGGSVYYPQLVGGLLWQLKKLISYSEMVQQSYSNEEICRKLGIRAKRAKEQSRLAVRRYSCEQLRSMVVLSTRIDSLLRESRGELQPLLMELYIYYMIERKGDAATLERSLSPLS